MKPGRPSRLRASGIWQLAAEQFEPAGTASRILPMEGMRGFAVLMVFLVHWHALFSSYVTPPTLSWRLSEYGHAIGNVGVDVFFILSGYLIYGAILRKRTGMLPFLRRRVRRIYPTFICVFAMYLLLMSYEPSISKVSLHHPGAVLYLVENLLLLPGILPIIPIVTVAWSLSYEFFFYLSMPITVQLLGMRTWPERYRVLLLCITAGAYACLVGMGHAAHIRMLMFVAGMLLYEATAVRYFDSQLGAGGELLAIGLFLLALHFVALVELDPSELSFLPGAPNWLPVYRTLFLALTGSALTLYSFRFDGLLKRAFSQAPIRWLGNMSYSYYLIHGLALHAFATAAARVFPHDTGSVLWFWLLLSAALLCTFAASTGLFLVVEKPMSLVSSTTESPRASALPLANESVTHSSLF